MLGYPADRVTIVEKVRCYGCPRFPFATMQLLQSIGAAHWLAPYGHEGGYTDFTWASVEYRFPAPSIETAAHRGWGWFELRDSTAPAADIGALRLLAVFLAHWDNKVENQRLVCLEVSADGGCARPLAMMQDLGSTFGPTKANVSSWAAHPIWADRATCTVSMRHLPYHGGTFPVVRIPEAARQRLAAQLSRLSSQDIRALFAGARFPSLQSNTDDDRDLDVWTAAFRDRARQIQGTTCPA
jgi:hypothetical protein